MATASAGPHANQQGGMPEQCWRACNNPKPKLTHSRPCFMCAGMAEGAAGAAHVVADEVAAEEEFEASRLPRASCGRFGHG